MTTSLQPLISELERYREWAVARFGMEILVPSVITIQTAGRRNVLGHFASKRWALLGEENPTFHEVNVVAEGLNRPLLKVLETMHHELCHQANDERGVKDCNKVNYHNKRFRETAELYGLNVERMGRFGWANTSFPEEMQRIVLEDFQPDEQALRLFRVIPLKKEEAPKTTKWFCDCTSVRIKELNATCNSCGKKFEKEAK